MNEKFTLIVRALPGNWRTHPYQRLKALLKVLKRAYGFDCVSCQEVKEKKEEGKPEEKETQSGGETPHAS